MRKVSLLLSVLLFSVMGCNTQPNSSSVIEQPLTILTPTGAPSLAFYGFVEEENFKTNNVPTNIAGAMSTQDYDIIVIDIITGLKMIEKGAQYSLDSILTFGNFYVLSLGNDDNKTLDETDVVVSWGKDLTPDYVYKSVYETITPDLYVAGVSDVAPIGISGKANINDAMTDVDYIYIAQPLAQKVLQQNANAIIYANVKEEFSEKYSTDGFPQAALFVSKNAQENKPNLLNQFHSKLQSDITALLANPALLDEVQSVENETKFGIAIALAKAVIQNNNGIGLGYQKASDYLEHIETYYEILNLGTINQDYISK